MNTVTKAIAILTLTLLTSACHTRQQTLAIEANQYTPITKTQPKFTTPSQIIEDYEKNHLNCGDAFVGVADCNIVTGRN
jgi:hypothetical protein